MEPLTITIIASIISAVVGTVGTGTWAGREEIRTFLEGKNIAVLGARGTGKTSFFLLLGALNMGSLQTEQTLSRNKTKSASIVLENNKTIRFKETFDLPGSEEYRDSKWKDAFKDANIVLYLVNAAALLRGVDRTDESNNQQKADDIKSETQKRVKEDLENIQGWISDFKGEKKHIFIIGNHFDAIDANFDKNDRITKYHEEFINNEDIKRYSQGMTIIIGSLKTKDSQNKLLEKIFG